MKNKTRSSVIVIFLSLLSSGCVKEPPKCSDDGTFTLIRQIMANQLMGLEGITEKEIQDNMKIQLPRATAFDEKIKKYNCEARLIGGSTVELPIKYESQLDDNDQHIVFVNGITRQDLLLLRFAITEEIKSKRAKTGEITSPSTADTLPQSPPITSVPEKNNIAKTSIRIDIENENDLQDGTYLAKEYEGRNRYALITHDHGGFMGGDVMDAVCTDGYLATELPEKFRKINQFVSPTDFIFTKCEEN